MSQTSPASRRDDLQITALVLCAVLCLLGGVATLGRIKPPPHATFDFVQEWASIRNHFDGRAVYAPLNETMPNYLGPDWRAVHVNVNAHPPASILMLLPLGWLDYREAHAAWNLLSLLCLGVSLWLLIRAAGLGLPVWSLLPIGALVLTSNSLAQQLFQGQFNLLLLLLLTAAWAAGRAHRPGLSGILVGIAAAIKLFPAFLLLLFLARREWKAVAGMVVAFLALNAVTAGVLGLDCYATYFGQIVPTVSEKFRDYWPNASLTGFWSKLFDAPNGHVVPLLTSPATAKLAGGLSALLVIAVTAWKCATAKTSVQRDAAFGLCVIAMLLVSPITWDHYFLMLILPAAILWTHLPPGASQRVWLVVLAILLVTVRPRWLWDAVIPGPGELVVTNVQPSVASPLHVLTVISYQFYSLLALFVLALLSSPANERSPSAGASPEME